MAIGSKILAAIFCWFIFTSITLALEPPNIQYFKQKLIHYHESGQYQLDVNQVTRNARKCLEEQMKLNINNKKLALILDIDDTSLSLYDFERKMNFGFSDQEFKTFIEKANMQPILGTLRLYNFAKKHGVAVFFISGRRESWRDATVKALKTAGYENWDGLYLRPDVYFYRSIVPFKLSMRKLIRSKGYEIVGSLGDQESDFMGGDSMACRFKLPNPNYLISINKILSLTN